MKKLLVLLCILSLQFTTFAQEQEDITAAFKVGDVEKLSQYFDENVDLTVLTTEGIFSKVQSKVILRNFFATNIPEKFTLQHQGGTEMAKYIIGTLVANNKSYRVSVFFKKTNQKIIIQKIRIEDDK